MRGGGAEGWGGGSTDPGPQDTRIRNLKGVVLEESGSNFVTSKAFPLM